MDYGKSLLIFINQFGKQTEVECAKSTFVIGRKGQKVDYEINCDSLSRKHLKIIFEDGRVFIEDLGTTNGSYLNSKKIKSHQKYLVTLNDKVQLGKKQIILKFKIKEPEQVVKSKGQPISLLNQDKTTSLLNPLKQTSQFKINQLDESIVQEDLLSPQNPGLFVVDKDNLTSTSVEIMSNLTQGKNFIEEYESELKNLYEKKYKAKEEKLKMLLQKEIEEEQIAAKERALKLSMQSKMQADKILKQAKSKMSDELSKHHQELNRIKKEHQGIYEENKALVDKISDFEFSQKALQENIQRLMQEEHVLKDKIQGLYSRKDELDVDQEKLKREIDQIYEKKLVEKRELEEAKLEKSKVKVGLESQQKELERDLKQLEKDREALEILEKELKEEEKYFFEKKNQLIEEGELKKAQLIDEAESFASQTKSKAQEEANKIIKEANAKSESIISQMLDESKNVVNKAQEEAKELKAKTEKECEKLMIDTKMSCELKTQEAENRSHQLIEDSKEKANDYYTKRIEEADSYFIQKKESADSYYSDKISTGNKFEKEKLEKGKQTYDDFAQRASDLLEQKTKQASEQFKSKMARAKEEAAKIVGRGKESAEKMLKEAHAESRNRLEKANKKIHAEKLVLEEDVFLLQEKKSLLSKELSETKVKLNKQIKQAQEKADKILGEAQIEEKIIRDKMQETEVEMTNLRQNIEKEKSEVLEEARKKAKNVLYEVEKKAEEARKLAEKEVKKIKESGEKRKVNLQLEYTEKETKLKEKLKLEEQKMRKDNIKILSENMKSLIESYLSENKSQWEQIQNFRKKEQILSDIEILVKESLAGNTNEVINAGVMKHISLKKETLDREKQFWKRVGIGSAVTVCLAVIVYFVSQINISEDLANRKTASESYLDNLEKERNDKKIYRPQQDEKYKQSYYENFLYTKGFVELFRSEMYQDAWIVDLSSFMLDELDLNENSIVRYMSEEAKLFSDFADLLKKVDPEDPDEGLKEFKQREKEFNRKVTKSLGGSANFSKYLKYRERFYFKKLKEWKFKNRKK